MVNVPDSLHPAQIDFNLLVRVTQDVDLLVNLAKTLEETPPSADEVKALRRWLQRAYVTTRPIDSPLALSLPVALYRGHVRMMEAYAQAMDCPPFPAGMHADLYQAFLKGVEEMFASLDGERSPIFGTDEERERMQRFVRQGDELAQAEAWHHVKVWDVRNECVLNTWHCPKHWHSATERMVFHGVELPTGNRGQMRQPNGGTAIVRLVSDPGVLKHVKCHECMGETEVG
jgi:hypothetical protein